MGNTRKGSGRVIRILALRASGFNIAQISIISQCDRQTVRQHVTRYQISPLSTIFLPKERGPYKKKMYAPAGFVKERFVPVGAAGKYDYLFEDLDTPSYWN